MQHGCLTCSCSEVDGSAPFGQGFPLKGQKHVSVLVVDILLEQKCAYCLGQESLASQADR